MRKIPLKELNKIKIADDGTHHVYEGKPLYDRRFKWVLKFHPPGLAPAGDESGAFHVDLNGEPIYEQRYKRTFGFYFDRAAVIDVDDSWYHITTSGEPAYSHRYEWTGNFQDGACTVRDANGFYFHIDLDGNPLYSQKWRYAGDFRDGIACVIDSQGFARHIDKNGNFVHQEAWLELDVFHKGFARARDRFGWCHVDRTGNPIYSARFSQVEPFYNGFALVRDQSGKLGIIDEKGRWVHVVRQVEPTHLDAMWDELAESLVSYWSLYLIVSGIKLQLFDALVENPLTIEEIAERLNANRDIVRRFCRALASLNLLAKTEDGRWTLTPRGTFFTTSHPRSLVEVALVWTEEQLVAWSHAEETIKTGKPAFDLVFGKSFFDWLEEHPQKAAIYHRAMGRYSVRDYQPLPKKIDFSQHATVMDVGGGIGILLSLILKKNPHLKGVLVDKEVTLKEARVFLSQEGLLDRIQLIAADFFNPLPASADAIVLSRVLHDWSDDKAKIILNHCHDALSDHGKLYIIELPLPDNDETAYGALLNLSMAIITGGKERTISEYESLLRETGFRIENILPISHVSTVMVATKT